MGKHNKETHGHGGTLPEETLLESTISDKILSPTTRDPDCCTPAQLVDKVQQIDNAYGDK